MRLHEGLRILRNYTFAGGADAAAPQEDAQTAVLGHRGLRVINLELADAQSRKSMQMY